ncbi:MAG: HAMP domain-containing sensor histidine kinase, partial [Candidatus Kapabacteria bacterium]|nr:HAMP domain-containing sensor histidine kinase [Candidatus Kapabacteria bacterium]
VYSFLENLLEWAMSQKGSINYSPGRINLKTTVLNVLNILNPLAKSKNIEISNHLINDVYILGDTDMTNTIFRNLISNAIKFTPNNGKISIKSDSNGSDSIISISDTGVGISKDNINNLFRIDFHSTSIGTNQEKGTGLGLILCKEFIEKQNGKIWVESEIGKGTTFYFTLPKTT